MLTPDNYWKFVDEICADPKGQLVVNVDGDELEIETVEFKTIKIKIGDTFELTLT